MTPNLVKCMKIAKKIEISMTSNLVKTVFVAAMLHS